MLRLVVPALFAGIMGVFLLLPVYDLAAEQFLQRDPVLMVLQAVIGISLGSAMSVLICKLAMLRTLFRQRLTAIFALSFIQCLWLVFFVFDVLQK